ncbi:MAG: homoserine dehydrogenase, partial [Acidobacteriia bacterium]|nr:homoserine dehydrogenase [Terriglobia bacterium]
MRVALIGYGKVGKAFARLLNTKKSTFPFRIVGIHTARHGTAYDLNGLAVEPQWGPAAASVEAFLDQAQPEIAVEITTLNPESGEPAISHIRSAFQRNIPVITANKGPIAHAYRALDAEARRRHVQFRFESTVMDGTPIFNNLRNNLPGVKILGFRGILNSTSKIVLAAMQRGLSMEDGIREAQQIGVAEADPWYDIDGWDSAAKTAALANVLMQAETTPQHVNRRGLRDMDPQEPARLAKTGKTIQLVSSAERIDGSVRLQVRP